MIDHFAELIFQLGEDIDLPLHIDTKRIVSLRIDHKFSIQIEETSDQRYIQIATLLADIPPGKYRVNLFFDALRYNHLSPRIGTLSFSAKTNQLALHDFLPFASMTVERLKTYLDDFIDLASLFVQHIERGTTSNLIESGIPYHLVGSNHTW